MAIRPFHQRMAELWTIQTKRTLFEDEQQELTYCMKANAKYCWQMALLTNQSLLASETSDINWQHEICRMIDELETTGSIKT